MQISRSYIKISTPLNRKFHSDSRNLAETYPNKFPRQIANWTRSGATDPGESAASYVNYRRVAGATINTGEQFQRELGQTKWTDARAIADNRRSKLQNLARVGRQLERENDDSGDESEQNETDSRYGDPVRRSCYETLDSEAIARTRNPANSDTHTHTHTHTWFYR